MRAKPGFNTARTSNIRNRRGLRGSGDGNVAPMSNGGPPAPTGTTSIEVSPGVASALGHGLDIVKGLVVHAGGDALTDYRRGLGNK